MTNQNPTPTTMEEALREKMAWVIDPEAFAAEMRLIRSGYGPGRPTLIRVDTALAKADAILALTSNTGGVKKEEGGSDANAHDRLSMREGAPRTFQERVRPWMLECFGPVIPFDKVERGDRLLEEVLELLQSGGYDPARVGALRDYVFGRPVGEPAQEVGGVMVTVAAYCNAFDLDMREAGETELARIWAKVPQIRAKQAAKPTGSALPIASGGEHDEPIAERSQAQRSDLPSPPSVEEE